MGFFFFNYTVSSHATWSNRFSMKFFLVAALLIVAVAAYEDLYMEDEGSGGPEPTTLPPTRSPAFKRCLRIKQACLKRAHGPVGRVICISHFGGCLKKVCQQNCRKSYNECRNQEDIDLDGIFKCSKAYHRCLFDK